MRKKWIALLLLFIFALFFLFFYTSTNRENYVKNLIEERISYKYNNAIVVATIDPEKTLFYSYGNISNDPSASPVTRNTSFPIASITKVFTTLLLAQDVVAGRVKLTDKAERYLPKNIILPTYKDKEITLEDLATHTTGLPEIGVPSSKGLYPGYNKQEFYGKISKLQLKHAPGEQYHYSNVIGLLGDITANVANRPYAQLLQENILDALNMPNTKLVAYPTKTNTVVMGYNAEDEPGLPWAFPILESAGAMHSTAEDLAKFVAANMGITKTALYPAMQLSHRAVHSQGGPLIDVDFPGAENLEIGLGWNIDKEHNLIWKNGNFPNYTSFIGFNTQTKHGVVVLTNSANVTYTDNLALHLLNHKIKLFPLRKEIELSKNTIEKYAGKYHIDDDTDYIFIAEENHIKAQHIANGIKSEYFNLYPMNDYAFFGKIADAVFSFYKNDQAMKVKIKEGKSIKYGNRHP